MGVYKILPHLEDIMKRIICTLALSLMAYSCGIEDLQEQLSNRDDTDTSEPRARKLNDETPQSSDGQGQTAELTYRNSCMYELKKADDVLLYSCTDRYANSDKACDPAQEPYEEYSESLQALPDQCPVEHNDFVATWGCLYSFANSEGLIVDKTVQWFYSRDNSINKGLYKKCQELPNAQVVIP